MTDINFSLQLLILANSSCESTISTLHNLEQLPACTVIFHMLHNDFRKSILSYYVDMTQHIRNLSFITCFFFPYYICILTLNLMFSTFFSQSDLKYTSCEFEECRLQRNLILLPSNSQISIPLFSVPCGQHFVPDACRATARTLSAKPEADNNISLQLHKIDLIFMPFISSVLFFFYLSPLFFSSLPCVSIISPSVDFKE